MQLRGRGCIPPTGLVRAQIDGSRIRGGVRAFRLRPEARGSYSRLLRPGPGGTANPRTGYDRGEAGHTGAVYGSVRGCIRGHSDLAGCHAAWEGQRLGITSQRVRAGQDKSCNVRWTRNTKFAPVRCDQIVGLHAYTVV
jgi:hypothetical protein